MSKKTKWVEIRYIRDRPVTYTNGHRNADRPFVVYIVTDPIQPGEPHDQTNPKRGARGMDAFETFPRACQAAATYSTDLDYRVRRLQERLTGMRAAVYEYERTRFEQQGAPA